MPLSRLALLTVSLAVLAGCAGPAVPRPGPGHPASPEAALVPYRPPSALAEREPVAPPPPMTMPHAGHGPGEAPPGAVGQEGHAARSALPDSAPEPDTEQPSPPDRHDHAQGKGADEHPPGHGTHQPDTGHAGHQGHGGGQ